ncbi:hypothetical protein [Pseudovibrio sp. Tun.PSC04-5.I4]|uniref:hypothetical protein n=1 Tax=Pseudovibrio sp. Tun.PSC04-5.I4 TaxID=1798213 RepID=UPI0008826203|nr:hypothetical protein [Pseudovibrio sp. Tun.PSC04-5.I4]SDR02596.1 hypothetical protein SAMN04515695_2378 [Pseudovibrio sp. Tun.PSC04-5.I4]
MQEIEVFDDVNFRLLRLAARIKTKPRKSHKNPCSREVVSIIGQLMNKGIYVEEFAYLEDPNANYFELQPWLEKFLRRLNWRCLSDEEESRFLTALYATIGKTSDLHAYYAIIRWMEEVGDELDDKLNQKFVADGIGAERIYGCYYSYSEITDGDLIPSVKDPIAHNWVLEGEFRPILVFAEWLANHPNDFERCRPFNEELLSNLAI